MAGRTITMKLERVNPNEKYVSVDTFVSQLKALEAALVYTELDFTGEHQPVVRYNVIAPQYDESATIVLEAVSPEKGQKSPLLFGDYGEMVVERFFNVLSTLKNCADIPNTIGTHVLLSCYNLTIPLRNELTAIHIENGESKITMNSEFQKNIRKVLGPDIRANGYVSGMLKTINLHGEEIPHIYSPVGHGHVACTFPIRLKREIDTGIGRHVSVYGVLYGKQRDSHFPYAVSIKEIDILSSDME